MDVLQQILFGSTNSGKFGEAQQCAARLGLCLVSPSAVGKGSPPEVAEDAASYLENASHKAASYFEWSGFPTLADDSGLEVAVLAGAPGIVSARFAESRGSTCSNNALLLQLLEGTSNRAARFVSSMVFRYGREAGDIIAVEAVLEGVIAQEPSGKFGFGYDPLFIPSGQQHTLATMKETNVDFRTHRVLACEQIFPQIQEWLLGRPEFTLS